MIISKLGLRNWRNFRSTEVALAQRVFVIGPNASGKSNLLDSIRFLRDIAKPGGGLQRAITVRGGLSKIRSLTARREADVEIEAELSSSDDEPAWRYAIGITQQVRGYRQPHLRYEKVWRAQSLVLERPDEADREDELRLTQTHLEQVSANRQFREVARFFESIKYLHLVPQLVRHPEAFQGPSLDEDPYGRNFLQTVAKTPEKTRISRLRKIEAALRQAVPQLKSLTEITDETGVPHLEAVYEHWRPNAGRQRDDQLSDGTLRLLALFWSLLDGDSPLLLEEPELYLHSSIVARLPSLFYRLARERRRQIFVSTHSWDLLSEKGIGGEEVLVLTPDQEGTKLELASSIADVRELLDAGLSVGDAVLPRTTPPGLNGLELSE